MKLIYVGVAILVAAGCARKEEAPPRTTVADSVVEKKDPPPPPPPAPVPVAVGGDSIGIRGTELARIDSSRSGWHGYVYREYCVVVREDTSGGVGEEIRVARRQPGEDAGVALDRAIARPDLALPNDDANFFFGLSGNRIFLDVGTGSEPRGLVVHDIASRRIVYTGSYSAPITLLDSNRLEYFKEIDTPPPSFQCPQEAEWKANELGIAYERRIIVDLSTKKETPTDEVRCAPRQ